jgi:hypothetical protein
MASDTKYPYGRRLANLEKLDTRVNLEDAAARCHAESNKAKHGSSLYYKWNLALRALWQIRKEMDDGE